jgi:hypothetical protein
MKSLADKQPYDALRGGDPDDDEDADSDLDITMDLNESDYLRPTTTTAVAAAALSSRRPSQQQQRRRQRWWWWRQRASAHVGAYRWGVDALLLLVIVGLLVERQWGRAPLPPAPAPERPKLEGSGDVTGFAPQ